MLVTKYSYSGQVGSNQIYIYPLAMSTKAFPPFMIEKICLPEALIFPETICFIGAWVQYQSYQTI